MGLASLQNGEDHRFEMATQLVAADGFHADILACLGTGVKGREAKLFTIPIRQEPIGIGLRRSLEEEKTYYEQSSGSRKISWPSS